MNKHRVKCNTPTAWHMLYYFVYYIYCKYLFLNYSYAQAGNVEHAQQEQNCYS